VENTLLLIPTSPSSSLLGYSRDATHPLPSNQSTCRKCQTTKGSASSRSEYDSYGGPYSAHFTPLPAIIVMSQKARTRTSEHICDAFESLSRSNSTDEVPQIKHHIPQTDLPRRSTSQPRTSSATSAATVPTRRTYERLSGHILSTLLRLSGRDAAEPTIPCRDTEHYRRSGTTQDITTTLPLILLPTRLPLYHQGSPDVGIDAYWPGTSCRRRRT